MVLRVLARFICVLAMILLLTPPVSAQVALNALDSCDALEELQVAVRSWVPKAPTSCRSPRGALERAVMSHLGPSDRVCLLAAPPSALLSGFSCIAVQGGGSAHLNCFRPIKLESVRGYKKAFEGIHDQESVSYMKRSASCRISTGDTGFLHPVMYPFALMHVSRSEFGFIGRLRPEDQGGGHAIHAFGRTDPALVGLPSAMEVVALVVGAPSANLKGPVPIEEAGWSLLRDDLESLTKELNGLYRRNRYPMKFQAMDLAFARPGDFTRKGKDHAERVQEELVDGLLAEGFVEHDTDDLSLNDGRTLEDVFAEISSKSPFGMRRMYSTKERHGTFVMLSNDRRPSCTDGGEGAILAMILNMKPDPDEASDYGSVFVAIGGAGACSRFTGATARYVNGLMDSAQRRAVRSLNWSKR